MTDPGVESMAAEPAHVQLVSAVVANLVGLKPYGGKRISRKRVKQLFPSVSNSVLEKRCKVIPGNWRFHQACKSVDFDDKASVAEQCLKVLEKYPDTFQGTFLLPSDQEKLATRVKDALLSDAGSRAELEVKGWSTIASWARDVALADGSGIVIPAAWLNTQDAHLWTIRFVSGIKGLAPAQIPPSIFFERAFPEAAPEQDRPWGLLTAGLDSSLAHLGPLYGHVGKGAKASPCPTEGQPTPAATDSKPLAAAQDKKGRKSAQAAPRPKLHAVLKTPPFDFANYSGPVVPVMPEEGNEEQNTEVPLKRSAPCEEEKENAPAPPKEAKLDSKTRNEPSSALPDKRNSAPVPGQALQDAPLNPLGERSNIMPA